MFNLPTYLQSVSKQIIQINIKITDAKLLFRSGFLSIAQVLTNVIFDLTGNRI